MQAESLHHKGAPHLVIGTWPGGGPPGFFICKVGWFSVRFLAESGKHMSQVVQGRMDTAVIARGLGTGGRSVARMREMANRFAG